MSFAVLLLPLPEVPQVTDWVTCEQVLLSRTRLRRGGHRNCVLSLLYIPPERSSGSKAALGQVCPSMHSTYRNI